VVGYGKDRALIIQALEPLLCQAGEGEGAH
jgi:hypothetical protein